MKWVSGCMTVASQGIPPTFMGTCLAGDSPSHFLCMNMYLYKVPVIVDQNLNMSAVCKST